MNRALLMMGMALAGRVAATCPVAPPMPRIAVASNCQYDVAMNEGVLAGLGASCSRTGRDHPVTLARGRGQALVAASGPTLLPQVAAFSVRDWNRGRDTMFDITISMLASDEGFVCTPAFAWPHVLASIAGPTGDVTGHEVTADIEGLLVSARIVASGEASDDSAVQWTAHITNGRDVAATVGLRLAWTVSHAGYSYIAWTDAESEGREPWNAYEQNLHSPGFDHLTISESRYPSTLPPSYLTGLSCVGPSRLIPPPTAPDRIAFGFDPHSRDPADRGGPFSTCFAWQPDDPATPVPHDRLLGAIEAMAYWWGDTPETAIRLEPGESTRFTVWEWAYLENPVQCDAGAPLVVECEGGIATARLDGSASFSTGGSPLWHEWWAPAGVVIADPGAAATEATFPGPGTYPVTLKAGVGPYERSCETLVHVQDTVPPVVVAPLSVRLLASSLSDCSAARRLEATASDGCDPSPLITHHTVPDIGTGGAVADLAFGPGVTRVVFTATDASGNVAVSETTVEIVDDVSPSFTTLSATPGMLWPPRHQLVPVAVDAEAMDACDASPDVVLMGVTSSEPEDDRGDGRTLPDVMDAEPGSDDRRMLLRAERSGRGTGRTYTLHYRAIDAAGNESDGSVTVRAPHDRRR